MSEHRVPPDLRVIKDRRAHLEHREPAAVLVTWALVGLAARVVALERAVRRVLWERKVARVSRALQAHGVRPAQPVPQARPAPLDPQAFQDPYVPPDFIPPPSTSTNAIPKRP